MVHREIVGGGGVRRRADARSASGCTSPARIFAVPRNIRCSNRCAKPVCPGSTSLREPVCTTMYDGHDVGVVGGNRDQPQPVGQILLRIVVGEYLLCGLGAQRRARRSPEAGIISESSILFYDPWPHSARLFQPDGEFQQQFVLEGPPHQAAPRWAVRRSKPPSGWSPPAGRARSPSPPASPPERVRSPCRPPSNRLSP